MSRLREARRDVRVGVRIGMFVLAIPAIFWTAVYFLEGGTLSGFLVAAIDETLSFVFAMLSWIGFAPALLLISAALLVRRLRARSPARKAF